MHIGFHWWEDCPSHEQAYKLLQEALSQTGIQATVERIEVKSHEEAATLRFPGSPTIHINGIDLDPAGAEQNPVGLSCRVYRLPDGRFSPVPALEIITNALQEAQRKEQADNDEN